MKYVTDSGDVVADRTARRPRHCYLRSRYLRHKATSQECTDDLLQDHISTFPDRTPLQYTHTHTTNPPTSV